ncbi:Rod shape-determining protein MreB [Dirofilaria immitis]|nr:Rod shape-determining protein MreB [Dirofilaria immitis]
MGSNDELHFTCANNDRLILDSRTVLESSIFEKKRILTIESLFLKICFTEVIRYYKHNIVLIQDPNQMFNTQECQTSTEISKNTNKCLNFFASLLLFPVRLNCGSFYVESSSELLDQVLVTEYQVAESLTESVHQIISAIGTALESTPPELSSDIVDKEIVLSGGGGLLRNLGKVISETTKLPVRVADDPYFRTAPNCDPELNLSCRRVTDPD